MTDSITITGQATYDANIRDGIAIVGLSCLSPQESAFDAPTLDFFEFVGFGYSISTRDGRRIVSSIAWIEGVRSAIAGLDNVGQLFGAHAAHMVAAAISQRQTSEWFEISLGTLQMNKQAHLLAMITDNRHTAAAG